MEVEVAVSTAPSKKKATTVDELTKMAEKKLRINKQSMQQDVPQIKVRSKGIKKKKAQCKRSK